MNQPIVNQTLCILYFVETTLNCVNNMCFECFITSLFGHNYPLEFYFASHECTVSFVFCLDHCSINRLLPSTIVVLHFTHCTYVFSNDLYRSEKLLFFMFCIFFFFLSFCFVNSPILELYELRPFTQCFGFAASSSCLPYTVFVVYLSCPANSDTVVYSDRCERI